VVADSEVVFNAHQLLGISGYYWGVEGLSKDFLKPEEEEFGIGHAT
jgi:hypothetical protein